MDLYSFLTPTPEHYIRKEEEKNEAEASVSELNILSVEKMLEDYDYFWKTLDENSPNIQVIQRMGICLERIKREYRNKLVKEEMDLFAFSQIMYQLSAEFKMLGHIYVSDPSSYEALTSIYRIDSNRRGKWLNIIENQTSETSYRYLSKRTAFLLEQGDSVLGDPFSVDEAEPSHTTRSNTIEGGQNVVLDKNIQNGVAYIKIRSFHSYGQQEFLKDREQLLNFYKQIMQQNHLILDVTGNGGGDDAYWMLNLVAPLIEKPFTSNTYQGKRDGEINQYYLLDEKTEESVFETPYGSIGGNGRVLTYDEFLLIRNWQNLNYKDIAHLDSFYESSLTINPHGNTPFNGKIWLVVDDKVFSSSEAFVFFCLNTKFATVVGHKTKGNGLGANPYSAALPNSGLVFHYDGLYGFNPDGSSNCENGTTPDIIARNGETPLEACLVAIKEWDKSVVGGAYIRPSASCDIQTCCPHIAANLEQ